MIRVFHLITSLDTGGAETALYRLLAGLDRSRFLCRAASLIEPGPVARDIRGLGIEAGGLGMRRGVPDPRGMIRLVAALRSFRPHVLQTWLYHADLLGLAAGMASRVPNVVWNIRCAHMELDLYSPWTRRTLRALARLSGRPRAVLANSKAAMLHHQALGYRPKEFLVLPNGFDTDRYRPDPEARAEVRRELGVAPDAPLAGLVARWDHMKGHSLLCRAMGLARRGFPGLRLLLCGEGMDSSNQELAGMLADNGLSDATALLGRREDAQRVYAALDVHVLSSLGESFPNVVAEAMACGCPCVTTDVGDAAEIIGPSGRVVPARDPEALALAVAEVLAMDPGERIAMGLAGRARVQERYSMAACVDRYARLYERLAREARP